MARKNRVGAIASFRRRRRRRRDNYDTRPYDALRASRSIPAPLTAGLREIRPIRDDRDPAVYAPRPAAPSWIRAAARAAPGPRSLS